MENRKSDSLAPGAHGTPASRKTAIIIGAGPAGLTAAYELLTRTDIKPIILECSDSMGGIARTVNYKGNRIDVGGHRFFSKSDRVMNWWLEHLPLEEGPQKPPQIAYHGMSREVPTSQPTEVREAPSSSGAVMLIRKRKSRIYFLRQFFDYPIAFNLDTVRKLGFARTLRAAMSYLRSALFPLKNVQTLEQFFINRFGRELYRTFFQSYTEKVWGVSCSEISADWGQQRVKALSIAKTLAHFFKKPFRKTSSIGQKQTETSLIEQFLYPRLGPGQMWDTVAEKIRRLGGEIHTNQRVERIHCQRSRVIAVSATDNQGREHRIEGDYFFSTMPVKEFIGAIDIAVPSNVRQVSDGLQYRDFIIVGLLAKKLRITEKKGAAIEDNWIYLQEPDVKAARLQIFNNWSPDLVADPNTIWLGVEYFCYETDPLWKLSDSEMAQLATAELDQISILSEKDVLDSVVIRMPKTYPAYFGTYKRFDAIRGFVDQFQNLFLIGRNGMHRYNNQDHSMLTAMLAVDNITSGRTDKSNLWEVNTEMEYHEARGSDS
jgi:protoporphyrinogen oxidase